MASYVSGKGAVTASRGGSVRGKGKGKAGPPIRGGRGGILVDFEGVKTKWKEESTRKDVTQRMDSSKRKKKVDERSQSKKDKRKSEKTSQSLPEQEDTKLIRRIFDTYNRDDDEYIDAEEFQLLMWQLGEVREQAHADAGLIICGLPRYGAFSK